MKVLSTTVPTLLAIAMLTSAAVAQTDSVRRHRDPNFHSFNGSSPGKALPSGMDPTGPSAKLSDAGDAAAKKDDWETARSKYQSALDLWPDNTFALYGLARCAENDGNAAVAADYYRRAIYSHDPKEYGTVPGDGYRTNDVSRMMDFALLLSRSGQAEEARKVYTRAAHVLNYQDSDANGGKPFLKVLLPEFGPRQAAPSPLFLQAMAHVTLSLLADAPDSVSEVRTAVRLAPDSAVANYYLGYQLPPTYHAEAKAAFLRAVRLDMGGKVSAAAEENLRAVQVHRR